jgi:hypothetical protein
MCLRVSYKKKKHEIFFASFKSLIKGVGYGAGSGSADPEPHQNAKDPNTGINFQAAFRNRDILRRIRIPESVH